MVYVVVLQLFVWVLQKYAITVELDTHILISVFKADKVRCQFVLNNFQQQTSFYSLSTL